MSAAVEGAGVEAVVFDIGNVLVSFDFAPFYSDIAAKSEASGRASVEGVLEPVKQAYENGRIGRQEFVSRSIQLLGYQGTEAEFQSAWENIFTLNPPMEQVVKTLSGQVPLFLLSNTNDLHREFLFRQFAVFGLFRGGVYSDEAQVSKPDLEIFRITRDQFDLNPDRTLFVDDLRPNVEAAREAGFQVFKYSISEHTAFEDWLKAKAIRSLWEKSL
jgi:HAD superfamily hydrolase (TIGR01509 family)